MQHDLVTEPFEHTDGWVYPPTRPGSASTSTEDRSSSAIRSEKVLQDPKAYGALV